MNNMATNQDISKADEVRALLAALNTTLEKEGFLLLNARFKRNEQGELGNIVLNYEEKGGNL